MRWRCPSPSPEPRAANQGRWHARSHPRTGAAAPAPAAAPLPAWQVIAAEDYGVAGTQQMYYSVAVVPKVGGTHDARTIAIAIAWRHQCTVRHRHGRTAPMHRTACG